MKDSNQKDLLNKLNLVKNRIVELEDQLADEELQLEESEKLMMQLLDSTTDSVFLHDFNGNFVYVNEAAYKTRGYTKKELLGMNLHNLDIPKYEKLIESRIKELIEKGECIFESAHFRKDGSQMRVEIHSKIIEYKTKPFVLSYVRDITQREKVENDLVSAREQYRALFDDIGVGVSFISPKMEILDLNNQMKEWFPHIDVSKKPICYKAFNDPPREDICIYCPTYKTLKDGKVHESVTDTPMGGEIINYRIVSSPIRDDDGNVVTAIEMVEDITERQKAMEKLRQSEEKFRAVAESAIDAIITVDSIGLITFFNHSLLELFGYSASELSGKPISILIPSRYKNEHLKGMKLLESGEKRRTGKTTVAVGLKKDGTEFPCEMSLSSWKSGKDTYFTSIIRDLTERKKAEEALRESEEKYRTIFEDVQDVFFQTDIKGKIIEISPSVEKQFGIKPNKLIGNHVDMLYFNFEDRKKLIKALQEKGEVSDYEITLKDSENQLVYVSANVHFIYDLNNQPIGIEGALRDITDRKLAENALKNSEAEYKAIFENSKSAVAVYNAVDNGSNFIFKDFNKAAEKIEKIKREDIIGRKINEVFPSVVDFGLFEVLQSVWRTGNPEKLPVSIYRDERIWGWRENYVYKLPSGDVIAVYDDLTEIKQYEEELEKNQKRLKSLVKILQYKGDSVKEFLDYALEEAIRLTESKIGYIAHYYEDKELFVLNTWSHEVMNDCSIKPLPTVFKLEETGIWTEPVRQRKPLILNDFQAPNPLKRGYPEGHSTIYKYMTIPVFSGDKIVSVVAVGNKETDYTETDVLQLELLMDGVWKVVDRRRAEEALKSSEIRLSDAMDIAHLANWELDVNNQVFIFNDKFYSILGTTAKDEGSYHIPLDYYIKEYVHPDDAQFIREGVEKSLEIHEPTFGHAFGHRIIRKDGETRYVAIRIKVDQFTENENAHIYGTVQDITERKIVEEKLKESLEEKKCSLKRYITELKIIYWSYPAY